MLLVSPNARDLAPATIETKMFPDGDRYVRIPGLSQIRDEVTLLHRLYPAQNDALVEVFLMLKALKERASPTLVAPYLPYARQDKTFLEGEIQSAQLLCGLLKDAGCKKLITFDCHFLKKEGTYTVEGLTIENRSLGKNLIAHVRSVTKTNPLVISPDEGAAYLTGAEGKSMKKVRGEYSKADKEVERQVARMERSFDVTGKDVIVIDDMVSTGGTMIKAVKNVKAGGARKVFCAATHGFFLKNSREELQSLCDLLVVSDTIASPVSIPLVKKALGL